MQILDDANREFFASVFVRLETLPKAFYQQQQEETSFYERYFTAVNIWAEDLNQIVRIAHEVASRYGLAAMDALHIAAALTALSRRTGAPRPHRRTRRRLARSHSSRARAAE